MIEFLNWWVVTGTRATVGFLILVGIFLVLVTFAEAWGQRGKSENNDR